MGGNSAPPVDYKGLQANITNAATQQTAANRPTINTPFGFQNWAKDAGGNWTMNTGLGGGLGQAAQGLQNQAGAMANPMDWSQFGQAQTGDQARDQAITGAYGQATSRLDPMWQQREDQQRTRLLNQGFDPTSEAFRTEMGNLGNQRTDAYNQAMYSAIGQGTQAGDSAFRNNMMARQQSIADALRQRGQPLQELSQLRGFMDMPGFNQDSATMQGVMGSASLAQGAAQQQFAEDQAAQAALAQGLTGAGGAVAAMLPLLFSFMSDERAKTNIQRLEENALPGVPWATWEYREGYGPPGLHIGVIAQDLEKVRPELVTEIDGMKHVNYSFVWER